MIRHRLTWAQIKRHKTRVLILANDVTSDKRMELKALNESNMTEMYFQVVLAR